MCGTAELCVAAFPDLGQEAIKWVRWEKSLPGPGAGGQGWMRPCIAAPCEQRCLLPSSLALASACLIKCKHLNELSYSVDFLSIILAKLFALLTSWQAFQAN